MSKKHHGPYAYEVGKMQSCWSSGPEGPILLQLAAICGRLTGTPCLFLGFESPKCYQAFSLLTMSTLECDEVVMPVLQRCGCERRSRRRPQGWTRCWRGRSCGRKTAWQCMVIHYSNPTIQAASYLDMFTRAAALPVRAPLKAALTGLELLLARAQLWEETAAWHVSLKEVLQPAAALAGRWRKLELASWHGLLDRTVAAFYEGTYLFLITFGVCRPMLAQAGTPPSGFTTMTASMASCTEGCISNTALWPLLDT